MACLVVVGIAGNVRAALISYESFTGYTAGNIAGQAYRGTGYAPGGSWYVVDPNSGSTNVHTVTTTGGLTYRNLVASGGAVTTAGDGSKIVAAFDGPAFGALYDSGTGRIGAGTISGTLYLSFLYKQLSTTHSSEYGYLSTWDTATSTAASDVGMTWNASSYTTNVGTKEGTLLNSDGDSHPLDNETHLFVVKYNFGGSGSDSATIWMDPDLSKSEADQSSLTTYIKNYSSLPKEISFHLLRLCGGNLVSGVYRQFMYDEIRLGNTWADVTPQVPEPGAFALLAAGLLGLLVYAWKKRN